MARSMRLRQNNQLVTWDSLDAYNAGVRLMVEGNGVNVVVTNGVSSMGRVLDEEELESLRQWLNTRHDESSSGNS